MIRRLPLGVVDKTGLPSAAFTGAGGRLARQQNSLQWCRSLWQGTAAFLFVLFATMPTIACAATPQNDLHSIRVVMDDNYPPYAFRDNDGALQGISVDQWRLWEKRTGIRVELQGMDWQEALRRMHAGEFDVIDTIFETPERELEYAFTPPYARLEVPIFFSATISGITDLESLRGFAVAAKAGDANVDILRQSGVDNLHLYPSYETIVAAARDGKVNVFVADAPPALYYLSKLGISDRFKESAPINVGEFHRAVRKDNTPLLQAVERGFAQLSEKELQRIDEKWMGTSIGVTTAALRYLFYVVGVGGVLILGLVLWNLMLSHKVNLSTAELRASESRLRTILEAEPEGVMLVTPDGRLLEINPAGLAILQASSLSELQQQNFEDFVVPEHRALVEQLFERMLVAAGSDRVEVEVKGLRGEKRWLALHTSRFSVEGGEPPALVVVALNITEHKMTEAMLVGQAQVMELIAANAPMNRTLDRLLQLVEAQMPDMTCSILLLDRISGQLRHAAAPTLPESLVRAIDGQAIGPVAGSCGTAAYSGRNIYVADIAQDPLWENYRHLVLPHGFKACWSTPLFDNRSQVLGTFAIYHRNVGLPRPEHLKMIEAAAHSATICIERGLTEQALRDSEQRFRQVVENIDEVFWIRDTVNNQILYVSPAYERVWGRSCSSLYGSSYSWLESVLPEDRDRVRNSLGLQVSGAFDIEYRIVKPDGTQKWIHSRAFPIRDESGTPYRVAGFAQDVTEKRNMAEHMRQVQKIEAIGTLAGGIAHDFNNVLSVINGNAELALRDMDEQQAAARNVQQILKAGHRARNMVQQILLFSRAEQSRHEVLDLAPVIQETLSFLRTTLPASVELSVSLASDAPLVSADATQIHQVILNLCTNAWHALSNTGGKIEVTLERAHITRPQIHRYSALAAGEYACICVRDNGAGMGEATQQRMFEPFFTTKAQGQGTGLGMSIVQGIVRSHGAKILVDSELQRGTEIKLYFPSAANELPTTFQTMAELPVGNGQHILCIDDEEALVMLVTRMLEGQGYRVTGLSDPEKGLAAFKEDPRQFDLIVTDYNMPGMNGLDVAKKILALRGDVPVILTSGFVTDELIQSATQAGIRQVLHKPSTIREFCVSVQAALSNIVR